MSGTDIRVEEQAAADAICAVEDVARCERLVPSGSAKTPDWRVTMTDGRVADVEVTLCTDEDAMWFMESLSPDGSPREWPDARLSFGWNVIVADLSPTTNRSRPLGKLLQAVRDVLVTVESRHRLPGRMREAAESELCVDADVGRNLGYSRHIFVLEEPHRG